MKIFHCTNCICKFFLCFTPAFSFTCYRSTPTCNQFLLESFIPVYLGAKYQCAHIYLFTYILSARAISQCCHKKYKVMMHEYSVRTPFGDPIHGTIWYLKGTAMCTEVILVKLIRHLALLLLTVFALDVLSPCCCYLLLGVKNFCKN